MDVSEFVLRRDEIEAGTSRPAAFVASVSDRPGAGSAHPRFGSRHTVLRLDGCAPKTISSELPEEKP